MQLKYSKQTQSQPSILVALSEAHQSVSVIVNFKSHLSKQTPVMYGNVVWFLGLSRGTVSHIF